MESEGAIHGGQCAYALFRGAPLSAARSGCGGAIGGLPKFAGFARHRSAIPVGRRARTRRRRMAACWRNRILTDWKHVASDSVPAGDDRGDALRQRRAQLARQPWQGRSRADWPNAWASRIAPGRADRLVWLHGASVGESLSLLPLIDRFIQRGLDVLVTSGTVSSARVLSARLPAGAFHQYAPIDAPKFVERFLDHWRPDIAVFAESELWPNIVAAVRARGAPLVLANARISRKSAERWRACSRRGEIRLRRRRSLPRAGLPIMRRASRRSARVACASPAISNSTCRRRRPILRSSPNSMARSARGRRGRRSRPHPGEEDLVLDAHVDMAAQTPSLLTIIAPRHRERGAEIVEAARARGLRRRRCVRRKASRGATSTSMSSTASASLASFFRSVGVVLMGKSLLPGGGQNPIEPAKLGCAILHGPYVENFTEVYGEARGRKSRRARHRRRVAGAGRALSPLRPRAHAQDGTRGRRDCREIGRRLARHHDRRRTLSRADGGGPAMSGARGAAF